MFTARGGWHKFCVALNWCEQELQDLHARQDEDEVLLSLINSPGHKSEAGEPLSGLRSPVQTQTQARALVKSGK